MTPIQISAIRQDFLLWSGCRFPRECEISTVEGFLNAPFAWFVHYEPVPEDITREQVEQVLREWDTLSSSQPRYYTDYPFRELGDKPYAEAPVREISLIGYDADKYVDILVEGMILSVKYGYIYMEPKRAGETPACTLADIKLAVCGGGQP